MDDATMLQREPAGSDPENGYEITFTDGSVHIVHVDDGNDVSTVGDTLTIYAPGRRTEIPWHRIRAVTLYRQED